MATLTDLTKATIQRNVTLMLLLFIVGFMGVGCGGNSDPGTNTDNGDDQETVAVYSTNPTSGLVALNVSFDASGSSGSIIEYRWAFGDGSTGSGSSTSHTYNQAGTYTTSLTVTDTDGVVTSASHNVYVFNSIDNDQVIIPDDILFHDKFNYAAGRDDPSIVSIFQAHGWASAKTHQDPDSRNPRGYMYTTDTIPAFSGPFPGASSSHVLAMEALPSTLGDRSTGFWGDMQTDIWLKYGNLNSSTDNIPANVWFQFWIYPTGNYDHGMKFIYPCRGDYPCQDLSWLFMTGSRSYEPHHEFLGDALNDGPSNDQFLQLQGFGAVYSVQSYYWGGGDDLGQHDVSEYLPGSRWTKVKFHVDTSGLQGIYEAWLQPLGGQEIKVAEWIGDVTPDFTWPVTNNEGHRVFVFPSTIGSPRALDPAKNFDSITYIDDFAMATSEGTLPQYPY